MRWEEEEREGGPTAFNDDGSSVVDANDKVSGDGDGVVVTAAAMRVAARCLVLLLLYVLLVSKERGNRRCFDVHKNVLWSRGTHVVTQICVFVYVKSSRKNLHARGFSILLYLLFINDRHKVD